MAEITNVRPEVLEKVKDYLYSSDIAFLVDNLIKHMPQDLFEELAFDLLDGEEL